MEQRPLLETAPQQQGQQYQGVDAPQYLAQYAPSPVQPGAGAQYNPPQAATPGLPAMQTVPVPPANAQPTHHLVLTTVITMICAFFNLSSLILGIPALLCSFMAYSSLLRQQFGATKTLGYTAVMLNIFNIFYTGFFTMFIIGMTIGFSCRGYYDNNNYYYYSC